MVMRSTVWGAAVLALAAPAAAQLQQPRSISMARVGGAWTPALFVCDATDADRVLALTAPARDRRATLVSYAKPGLAAQSRSVRIGQGDAGMSQVYYPLTDLTGSPVGNVHTVSPGVVEPGATTPTVTSVTLGRATIGCRFAPQTRVLGATAKRSIQVTATPRDGYRYRSYNYDTNLPVLDQPWGGRDTRASLTIGGGRLVEQRGGRRVYEFRNAGYVYRVLASVDAGAGGGGVQVWRDGRMLLSEPFGAYTAAIQP
ncbi:hypothetical protein AB5I41_13770 [Sphingomonas sp. MMS24-JH45]